MSDTAEISQDRIEVILGLVQAECAAAVGFDNVNAGELTDQRERALQYAKGEMPDLVMQLAGRSKVVSTDVADAIETAMPDLMDIFTGSDDVVVFEPIGREDVAAAKQEGDYLRHILFTRNAGWMAVYEAFKDALTCKTGVFSWRWEGHYAPVAEQCSGRSLSELQRAMAECEVDRASIEQVLDPETGEVSFNWSQRARNARGRIVVEAIAPEDLAVAADTRTLQSATYCCVRQRPRAQDLLAIGYDAEAVDGLPAWTNAGVDGWARDTVGESAGIAAAPQALRQVEIYRHYIRVRDDHDGRFRLYQVVTGGKGFTGVLVDIQEVSRVQLAAITPFINPHRFYGESIADKLMEIQKIKSSLMRMALDSGYFALNQRMEVDENGCGDYTIDDLLNNEPGRPIRVKRPGTVTPVASGALNYDPLMHLEYFSTVAEQRTGIVRNAQGLNPDTLHDTRGGLELLNNNAQKRLRLIARTFAETGYKDFLVNLHATIRENGASMRDTIRMRNDWVDIDPSSWRQRDDMTIAIGVGAGGRDHDVMMGQQLAMIQEKLIQAQGMPDGPLVSKENLYNSAIMVLDRMGFKAPEAFVSDPARFQAPAMPPPGPDPVMVKLQAEHAVSQRDLDRKQAQLEAEISLKHADVSSRLDLEKYRIDTQAQLDRERMMLGRRVVPVDSGYDGVGASDVHLGGEPG